MHTADVIEAVCTLDTQCGLSAELIQEIESRVRSHDALVEALQGLMKASEEWTGYLRDTHPARVRARAALKATTEAQS